MSILENALVNDIVSMKISQEEKAFPLQGPLIVISNRISALTVAPEVMVLDIPPNSFTEPVTATDTTVAAFQFWDAFRILADKFSRQMLFLIFHEAVLHSLLAHMGFKVPLAFAFFSDDYEQTTYLKHLFSWRGDPVLLIYEGCRQFLICGLA